MFKESSLTNLILLLAPITIGLLMAFLIPNAIEHPGVYAWAALACYGVGFALFAAAKVQNIRSGHLVPFGAANMLTTEKWAYRIGYALMALGLLIFFALLAAAHLKA